MLVSFFEEGPCYGVDYSGREDCLGVVDVEGETETLLKQGRKFSLVDVEGTKTVEFEPEPMPDVSTGVETVREVDALKSEYASLTA